MICARDEAKLVEAKREILAAAGKGAIVETYSADIADEASCKGMVDWLNATHGGVDFLINNAGRSIRRAIEASYDRFHDFERTMQLNYFGCLRVTMGFLPGMVAKKKGHIVNISSIGVLTNAPRFSAYVASKAALDAWTRCASSEYADMGISFTTINMPLVRTPMIGPTKIYDNVPVLSPEDAANMIAEACVEKPVRIATRLGITGELLHALVPRVAQIVMNSTFRMFPDSAAAKGDKDKKYAAFSRSDRDAADDARHSLLSAANRRRVVRRPETRLGRRSRRRAPSSARAAPTGRSACPAGRRSSDRASTTARPR